MQSNVRRFARESLLTILSAVAAVFTAAEFCVAAAPVEAMEAAPALEQRLDTALAVLADMPSECSGSENVLPRGVAVDRAEWADQVLHVDLTLPLDADATMEMADVESITNLFIEAADPGRETAGIVIRYRTDASDPYRPLESLVPQSEPGVYAEPNDVAAADLPTGDEGGTLRSGPVANAGHQPAGALSGVVVFAAAGHGWTAGSSSWGLQRPFLLDMIEDYGNIDQLNYFVQHCYNAGATVVPFRPVGYQDVEIVLDQDDPGVTYTGGWTNSAGSPYYENNVTVSGVSYRFSAASVTETATARYTPNIPTADYYPVYTWLLSSTNRTTQKYRIVHSGGTTEVVIDHRVVGKGWVWLGSYYFEAGTGGYVEISNESPNGGNVIADAIRFGNGIGDVVGAGPGSVSGYPRDEEASRYWAESEADINAVGLSSSIYDCCSSDSSDNVGTAARWSREMNDTGFNNDRWRRVYLEFHSNAGSGSSRGTVALITGNATTNQASYAQIIGEEIEADMLVLDADFEHTWGVRNPNTYSGAYGAISTTNNNNEFDATILEVAFHDNTEDTHLLLDPKVRDAVARSSMHGIIRFLNSLPGSGVPLAFPPDRPRQVQAVHNGSGGVEISWIAPLNGNAYGDAPAGYRIYRSTNGYGFDAGTDVGNVLTATLNDIPADQATFIRVAAYSAGGESMPSETLAVRRAPSDTAAFLVVNGFDRVGRSQDPRHTLSGIGTQRRPILRHVNSFDYTVQHGMALASVGARFDSCSNEAIIASAVDLNDYAAIVWISGEESSADDTFNATEQSLVQSYLSGGGRIMVTGAEIGWDLDNLGNGVSFYNNFLKANYSLDDAATYSVGVSAGSIFAGLTSFAFDNGSIWYDAEYPDVLSPFGGSVAAMSYIGGTGGTAAVVYDGSFQVVNFGFPFELITSATAREQIMDRVVGFFFSDPFDADRDGDVDNEDLSNFADCLTGPESDHPGGDPCLIHDADADNDIDLEDFAAFQEAFTG